MGQVVTEEWKSLRDLWNENGQKPFDAISFTGVRFHCEALTPMGDATGWNEDGAADYRRDIDSGHWKLWKPEPKLVPHWPAVCRSASYWYLACSLFPTVEAAREYWAKCDIRVERLATEYPPVMLELKE